MKKQQRGILSLYFNLLDETTRSMLKGLTEFSRVMSGTFTSCTPEIERISKLAEKTRRQVQGLESELRSVRQKIKITIKTNRK